MKMKWMLMVTVTAVVVVGFWAAAPSAADTDPDPVSCYNAFECRGECLCGGQCMSPPSGGLGYCECDSCGGEGWCRYDSDCGWGVDGQQCCSVLGTCGQCDDFFPWSETPTSGEVSALPWGRMSPTGTDCGP
jgi:hypothetical protein